MPITVRGKFLIKQLWTKKFSCDQEIDKDDRKDWLSLSDDLNKLQFPKNIINSQSLCDIYMFCDANFYNKEETKKIKQVFKINVIN